jgi:hypothetical protein
MQIKQSKYNGSSGMGHVQEGVSCGWYGETVAGRKYYSMITLETESKTEFSGNHLTNEKYNNYLFAYLF